MTVILTGRLCGDDCPITVPNGTQTCSPFPYKRIVVVGVTGCGKSILAERLAAKLGLEFIELDALYWKPDWVESNPDEFRERVKTAIRAQAWALAGNYSQVRELVWPRAEALIWLDYPFLLVFRRLWNRLSLIHI